MPSNSDLQLDLIRDKIKKKSPFSVSLTEEIIQKNFQKIRGVVGYLKSKYCFGDLKVLEIGSDYGEHLFFWGNGSEGIEVNKNAASFTNAFDFTTYSVNIEDNFDRLASSEYEAIHTNNLLEHLVSPHIFMARCYRLLQDNGILAIGHPVVPPMLSKWVWLGLGVKGWLASEHINFFTPVTARLMLERSGFEVLEQFSPGFLPIHPVLAKLFLPYGVSCYSICRKRKNYRYPAKRKPDFDPTVFRKDLAIFHQDGK